MARWLSLLFLILASSLVAQIRMPAITAPNAEGKAAPLRLAKLEIGVVVVGNLATTTWDLTVANPQNRILEGELVFPLGEGQNVSRFAMEVNGKLREGVVVEKAKGREVFESIVRRGVDPGLLEKTEGNSFKARIYPIPPMGSKRVVLAYEHELSRSAQGGLLYHLPMDFPEAVEDFSLKVEVLQQSAQPMVESSVPGFSFQAQGQSYKAECRQRNLKLKEPLRFVLPRSGDESAVYVQRVGELNYFYLTVKPELPPLAKTMPCHLRIAWDASASAAKRDVARELEFLGSYLQRIQNVDVGLVVFRNAAQPIQRFQIRHGQWEDLKRAILAEPFDGGTQLGCLDFSDFKGQEVLLFTDGLSNLGESEATWPSCPVQIIHAAPAAQHNRLRAWAEATGGQCLNLNELEPPKALELLCSVPLRFISAQSAAGDLHEIHPKRAAQVRGLFSLAGKQVLERSEITLNFGYGDQIRFRKTFVIEGAKSAPWAPVARFWAQKKLQELELQPEENRAAILALGQSYGLVTEGTSLIVLDSVEDYLRYQIQPPEELRAAYERRMQFLGQQKLDRDRNRSEQVAQRFLELQAWLSRDFTAGGTIQGQVRDGQGQPLSGARITASGPTPTVSVNSGSDGRFELRNLAFGTWYLRCELKGYPSQSRSISLSLMDAYLVRVDFILDHHQRIIKGSEETDKKDKWSESSILVVADAGAPPPPPPPSQAPLPPPPPPSPEATPVDAVATRADGMWAPKKRSEKPAHITQAPEKASIELKAWSADAPYLSALKEAEPKERYAAYLNLRKAYGATPGFYLDAAEVFQAHKDTALALRILSNLAELKLEDAPLQRILGRRLLQMGQSRLAIRCFERVLRMREEEPQSWRDLALACEAAGEIARAMELLQQVVQKTWDPRFEGVEQIALVEWNVLRARSKRLLGSPDPRLAADCSADIRVVLNWDTNDSDMDLWVTDPRGEVCKYNHNRTATGGRMSRDITQGYGPEEFLLRKAVPGKYKVQVNYYGTRQQTALIGPTTLHLELYTRFGTPQQQKKDILLRLSGKGAVLDVADFEFR